MENNHKSFVEKVKEGTLLEYTSRTNKLTIGDGVRVGIGLLIVYIVARVITYFLTLPF